MARVHVLHLIADRGDLAAVAPALRGGVDAVQVRNKSLPAADLLEAARAAEPLCRAAGVLLLINDRIDVALACGADGVHLAGRSLPPADARRIYPGLLGVSVHDVAGAMAAAAAGADYVTFGHVFPTQSKPGLPPQGLSALRAVVEAVDVPVLAIGGIGPDNAADVLACGCAGVAVISSILASSDPERATLRLRQALDGSPAIPRKELRRHASPHQR
jgi:thiamine-phosphate pyrophosphorylase